MRIQNVLTSIGLTLMTLTSTAGEFSITSTQIPQRYELDGTLEAINAGTISAQTSGVIKAVYGDVNNIVNKGDPLIEIDDTQQKAGVAQAEAALAQAIALNDDAQTVLSRNTRLQKQGTLSKSDYDRSVAQAKSTAANVQAAKAALTRAKTELSYTNINAPYAGVIMERFIEVGELVSPGQPLMSGYDSSAMRAVTALPQQVAKHYKSVEQISITVDGESYPAAEATMYPFADPERHSVRLRATLPAEATAKVMPGQWVKIIMTTGSREGYAIPTAAIMHRGELSAVYIRQGDNTSLRQVRLGNAFNQNGQVWYEVLAGLNEGDIVFDNALEQLATLSTKTSGEGE